MLATKTRHRTAKIHSLTWYVNKQSIGYSDAQSILASAFYLWDCGFKLQTLFWIYEAYEPSEYIYSQGSVVGCRKKNH